MTFTFVKIEVLIPEEYIENLRDELNHLGILTVVDYDHVVSFASVKGYWRPIQKANPFQGERGKISFGTECKMEFRCSYSKINEVKSLIHSIHPYEEPIINVIPLLNE
ncbi:YqfO family protein [Halalkalibacterium halodurans]|uniref:BH2593 protein n=1 Tax=Halalkalibacterium halodurans (strain ATCC BAA-125 / DSM 18197 / FERM 7344 / JCM 9153 / C-125) TaxID=272558 RepID=Q9K9Q2_HALH5|nr:YqfO family protein [Halalkalibacterium halodurans]MDY7223129.1 YqfO family protein [Halalkalibacterium halodurans]MDY7242350.1 YqfO family protein [Halalkalibacterium halodurans]MED4079737.1 YqfO family protein [Halalkalibacterium halodurans]MED4086321.1 YqfO family protein [Halalkalibacterium halodurans]MED4103334.1 YqfO family protein [Halalkalibacterium halodurans]